MTLLKGNPTDTARLDVLVVDDEEAIRHGCVHLLMKTGYKVEAVGSGKDCLDLMGKRDVRLVLLDLKMAGMGGIEVLERLRVSNPDTVVVIITGYATVESAVQAMKMGAYDYIPKPFTPTQVRTVVERGLEKHKLVLEKQRLHQEQEDLLLVMYHDLKAPLGVAKSYVLLVTQDETEKLSEANRSRLARATDRVDELLVLINDLCTMSKLEQKDLAPVCETVSLTEVIRQVADGFTAQAAEKGIAIVQEVPQDIRRLNWNRDEAEEILMNLVSNAVKFNRPRGTVKVCAVADEDFLQLRVSDAGIGMTGEERKRLFQRFYRVRNEKTRRIPGSGLGLSIVRKIVETRGGSVQVESEPDKGSTFTVNLPLEKGGICYASEEESPCH